MKTYTEMQSRSDCISQYNIVNAIRIILSNDDCIPNSDVTAVLGILSKLVTILRNPSVSQVLTYLIFHGAATSWILQVQLGLPEASIYRALRSLNVQGYVSLQTRFNNKHSHRSGPRPKVWGIIDCKNEQVIEATQLHMRCLSPKYRVAEEIAQTILDKYVTQGQITFRDIQVHVKEIHSQFNSLDIAELVAPCLTQRGVKVWR